MKANQKLDQIFFSAKKNTFDLEKEIKIKNSFFGGNSTDGSFSSFSRLSIFTQHIIVNSLCVHQVIITAKSQNKNRKQHFSFQ
jgi:hypothetical protein